MLFVELRFLPFFLIALSVYWSLPRNSWRKAWLLLCSYFFYAAWDWRFLSLILFSTVIDYVVGLRLVVRGARRRAWLLLSLCGNLGLLGVFKYFDFFVGSAADLLRVLGFQPNLPTLGLILPVGISFYTFQTLSYSLDVYYGRLQPVRSFLDLALFVAFFPQLVAGPIVRAVDFLPQLDSKRLFSRVDVRGALILFLIGYVKKACISDNLATVVDQYFSTPQDYNSLAAWTATLFYSVQIYCDFSGYSDMAIACAALMGYRLCLNFHYPYFATNIGDFWRRWHISLSSWLRDYLYIPLGGNRGSSLFVYRNLTLTLVLCGLWHGAAWNFVVFGLAHAIAVIVRIEWRGRLSEESLLRRAVDLVAAPLTFIFFTGSLIVFRAVGLQNTTTALRSFVLLQSPGARDFGLAFLWIFPVLGAAHWISYRRWVTGWWHRVPGWAFAVAYGCLIALVLPFRATSIQPFIYFQF